MRAIARISLAGLIFAFGCSGNDSPTGPTAPAKHSPPVASPSPAPTTPTGNKHGRIYFATASAGGMSITTDKDDYAPGDTVKLTGAGWTPEDTVNLKLTDDSLHEHNWAVRVDSAGQFRDSTYVVAVGDVGVTFTLTATSRSNPAQTLTVIFTDASVKVQSNLDGVTFTATVSEYNAFGCLAANLKGTTSTTIDFGGSSFTVNGSGGVSTLTRSIKFKAGTPSIQGAPFGVPGSPARYWSFSSTTGVTYTTGSDEICVSGNNNNTLTANYDAAPDLELVKSAAGAFTVGSNASYSIQVKNTGTASAMATGSGQTLSRIKVTDALPAGLTFQSGGSANGWGACTAVGQNVSCELGTGQSILPGASSSFNINVGVASGACPSVVNSAIVGGGNEPAGKVDAKNTGSSGTVNVGGCNSGPTTEAGGPYEGNEGSAIALSGASASGTATPLTYEWSVNKTGIDGTGSCTFSPSNTVLNPTITCNDDSQDATDGHFTVSLKVTDHDGLTASDNANLTVLNVKPTANAHGPYSDNEGTAISLSGSGADVGANDVAGLTYEWSVNKTGIDTGGDCTFSPSNTVQNPTITCTDDSQGASGGHFTVSLVVKDDDGGVSDPSTANLTVLNVKPTANAHGPYSDNEGTAISLSGSGADVGANDIAGLTYEWSVNKTGIDTGGDCTFSPSNTAQNPTITCTDDSQGASGGHFTVSLVVKDDDGGTSDASTTNLTVLNVKPTADAGGPYSGDEGSAITLSGAGDDAGSNDVKDLTYKWTVNTSSIDAGGVCTFDDDTKKDAKVTCTDDSGAGAFTLSLTVKDDDGGTSTASTANLTVKNVTPTMSISSPVDWSVWAINAPEFGVAGFVTASFSDAGTNDTHTCTIDWGDGDSPVSGTVSEVSGAGTCKSPGVNPYTDDGAGIYLITVTVTDDDGGQVSASRMIVVYDPSAGFVTGGGWINSPPGAYKADGSLTGRANFGFVSKYQKGANVPTGNTEFQFQAGNLNFHSDTYDWLVVNQNGVNAQFKGNGLINGQGCSADREGKCRFMLWAYDGTKNGGYDTFRIEIWTEDSGGTKYDIYDNGGSGGGGFSAISIAGGSIQVQTGKK